MGRLVLPSGRVVEIDNDKVWFLGADVTFERGDGCSCNCVDVEDLCWLAGYLRPPVRDHSDRDDRPDE